MCPDQESNQRPCALWKDTHPTEPHWPGWCYFQDEGLAEVNFEFPFCSHIEYKPSLLICSCCKETEGGVISCWGTIKQSCWEKTAHPPCSAQHARPRPSLPKTPMFSKPAFELLKSMGDMYQRASLAHPRYTVYVAEKECHKLSRSIPSP